MKILGISAFYHDSAAALIIDGKIIAAAQEERFTRKKHDSNFPQNAVKFCLSEGLCSIDNLDAIAFYDKPFLKFERLLETYNSFVPKGLQSFIASMPIWIKEKMFLKKIILDNLNEIEKFDKKKIKFLFPEHHLSHAASAYYPSNFEKSAILTIDGVGEWATASICLGEGKNITVLKELRFPHSVGLLYSAFTYYLGFKVNSGEYKLMGLAPYGNAQDEQTKSYINTIKNHLIKIFDDGSIRLNQSFFKYATGLRMADDKKWEKLFGFKKRLAETPIEQNHCNLAYAIQNVTEEIVLKMAQHTKTLTNCENICLAGGVALNCVANGKIHNSRIFKNIYIQPAAGDAGGALGAALAVHHIYYENEKVDSSNFDTLNGAFLGPDFSENDIEKMAVKYGANYQKLNFDDLSKQTAQKICDGKIIGWMQGKMEFGPRALGNRSILADPRNTEMQKVLNLKIKFRESFRPFAPAVLEEDTSEYFELNAKSPYMLLVSEVKKSRQKISPPHFSDLNMREKLYALRSDIPAVTHIDFSARVQTVSKTTNPKFHQLISDFKNLTRYGVLVNTSFNVRNEPIVCTPEDAYRCFMRTQMDVLVIGNYFFKKEFQPQWTENESWKDKFEMD